MNHTDSVARLSQMLKTGDLKAAAGALREALQAPFNLLQLQRMNALVRQHEQAWRAHLQCEQRIAIAGSYTTQPVSEAVFAAALGAGVWPHLYEAGYDSIDAEVLDPQSGLITFRPDIVLLAVGWQGLRHAPPAGATTKESTACIEAELQRWRQRWEIIHNRTQAVIVQQSFDLPPYLPLGRLENRLPWSITRFTDAVNQALWMHENARLRILDIASLTATHGSLHWFSPRWYHHSKHGFNLAHVADYTRALGGLLRAMNGRMSKCLVTDLDNTLWGGVIGDDGIGGIKLSSGDATSEAHLAFASYLGSLRQLGVILAICSKNNRSTVLEALRLHPEIPLREDAFAAIECNWDPKSVNLRRIAQKLNIGTDSLVFIDDNPAECEEVRQALPEVTVIEMAGDPADFPSLISAQHLFSPLDLTADDLARPASYQARAQMPQSENLSEVSLAAHLAGLDMQASIGPATAEDLPRIAQLFAKTNQFNLCAEVFSDADLRTWLTDPTHLVLCARLTDKHAAHGLVSCLVLCRKADNLAILNWVMSCRVFSRNLEDAVLNHILETALQHGCSHVSGRFIPTAKNDYARRFLLRLGIVNEALDAGNIFSIPADTPALPHHLRIL